MSPEGHEDPREACERMHLRNIRAMDEADPAVINTARSYSGP